MANCPKPFFTVHRLMPVFERSSDLAAPMTNGHCGRCRWEMGLWGQNKAFKDSRRIISGFDLFVGRRRSPRCCCCCCCRLVAVVAGATVVAVAVAAVVAADVAAAANV